MENPFELILEKLTAIERMVTNLSSDRRNINDDPTKSPEFLNVTHASQFLDLAKQTIYGLTAGRKIPHFKQGKRIYFKKNELIEWILKNRVKTVIEIETEASTWIANSSSFKKKKSF